MATNPVTNPSDYFTVPEVARELDVHPETVRTAVKQGRLPGYRVFNKLLIKKLDVEAYRAAARPDGVKTAGRPRRLGPPCDHGKPGLFVGDSGEAKFMTAKGQLVTLVTAKAEPVTEEMVKEIASHGNPLMNPWTGNTISVAAQPVHEALLKSQPSKLPNLMPAIGKRIAQRRRLQGLSQRELAERVGVSREMLSHYEVGRVHINASDLFHVADALSVPITFFAESGEVDSDCMTADEKMVLEYYRGLGTDLKMREIGHLKRLAESEGVPPTTALGMKPCEDNVSKKKQKKK